MRMLQGLYANRARLSRVRKRVSRILERLGLLPSVRRLWRKAYSLASSRRTAATSVGAVDLIMAVPDVETLDLVLNLAGEPDEILWLSQQAGSQTVFWDVGANIGLYSCAVAKKEPAAIVHAFEPVPETAALLRRDFELNRCSNARLHSVALHDRSGRMRVKALLGHPGSIALVDEDDPSLLEVVTRTGDDMVAAGIERPTLMKIDVEGYEYEVLDGMHGILDSGPLLILVESHFKQCKARGVPLRREERLFEQYGFERIKTWPGRWDDERSAWRKR